MKNILDKLDVRHFFWLGWRLANVDFRLRNEGSYLGNVWYVINPLLLFGVFYFIFVERIGGTVENYPAYLIVGILMFNFFSRASLDMTRIIKDSGFIKSCNFPREALVLSIVLAHTFAHLFEVVVFFGLLWFMGIPLISVFYYGIILFLLILFIYGLGLFLSAVTMYIVDFGNAWQFLTLLLLFITPVFHVITEGTMVAHINNYNPMFYFITATRDLVLHQQLPEGAIVLGIILFPILAIGLGQLVFSRYKAAFAELI